MDYEIAEHVVLEIETPSHHYIRSQNHMTPNVTQHVYVTQHRTKIWNGSRFVYGAIILIIEHFFYS